MEQKQFQIQKYREYKNTLEFLARAEFNNQSKSGFHPLKDCFQTQKMTQHAKDLANCSVEVLPNTQFSEEGGQGQY